METKSNLEKAFDKLNELNLTDQSQKLQLLGILSQLSTDEYQKGLDDGVEIYKKNK